MGIRKPVNLPSKQFPSRKAAKDWVRDEIKDHYDLEETVTDPLHIAVLFDLLDRDDDAAEKVGVGVAEFFIRLTSRGQGHIRYVKRDARGIWIRRVDGSEDDWSYTSPSTRRASSRMSKMHCVRLSTTNDSLFANQLSAPDRFIALV